MHTDCPSESLYPRLFYYVHSARTTVKEQNWTLSTTPRVLGKEASRWPDSVGPSFPHWALPGCSLITLFKPNFVTVHADACLSRERITLISSEACTPQSFFLGNLYSGYPSLGLGPSFPSVLPSQAISEGCTALWKHTLRNLRPSCATVGFRHLTLPDRLFLSWLTMFS